MVLIVEGRDYGSDSASGSALPNWPGVCILAVTSWPSSKFTWKLIESPIR